nr:MAG TPA: hypothetical protein [Caudoviricetes sp.]
MGMPPFSVSVPTSATLSYRYRNLLALLAIDARSQGLRSRRRSRH